MTSGQPPLTIWTKSRPQVTEIVNTVRWELLDAAKGAAAAAVTSRVDSLSDNLTSGPKP
jgi:hypothetical protein